MELALMLLVLIPPVKRTGVALFTCRVVMELALMLLVLIPPVKRTGVALFTCRVVIELALMLLTPIFVFEPPVVVIDPVMKMFEVIVLPIFTNVFVTYIVDVTVLPITRISSVNVTGENPPTVLALSISNRAALAIELVVVIPAGKFVGTKLL
jgi:hypothetical protein